MSELHTRKNTTNRPGPDAAQSIGPRARRPPAGKRTVEIKADGDEAMTFDEIGRRLGITRGGAWMLYRSAIRKLRASDPGRLAQLVALAQERDRLRREPLRPDWDCGPDV